MDFSLRNQTMVSLQNKHKQRYRQGGGNGGGGLGASLAAHNRQQQSQHYTQQQHYGRAPQHHQALYSQQQHRINRQELTASAQHQVPYHYNASGDHMSVGSHYSRESLTSSHNSSTVDEAYRRLGQRLSMTAHGGDTQSYHRPRRIARIELTAQSGFSSYADAQLQRSMSTTVATDAGLEASLSALSSLDLSARNKKVTKKRFSDHGDHSIRGDRRNGVDGVSTIQRHGNILRKVTVNIKELFGAWQSDHTKETGSRNSHNRPSPSNSAPSEAQITAGDLSPHRKAFLRMALDGEEVIPDNNFQSSSSLHPHSGQSATFGNVNGSLFNCHNGLLSAVIESSSQTSSRTNQGNERDQNGEDAGSVRSKESRCSSSIATRSSLGTCNSIRNMVGTLPPKGKCLTLPSAGVSNEGLDNADGNLVVYENDTITVTRKEIHSFNKDKMKNILQADFRVQSLLGQGTFAQVFQCLHAQTGEMVAIKVVKNKPAYTRQAAVEIDVLRALTRPSASDISGKGDASHEKGNKSDYMVEMVCYFMYKGHLCLVFELLGLNLYEVLKKRQFRGLPLKVVRKLIHQAVLGTKELAQRSIVHCDVKPENILLQSEDDVESVVTAGESKRLSSSLRSAGSLDRLPTATATITTTGEKSGNSSSTTNTNNTEKTKSEQKQSGMGMEQSPSTTTMESVRKAQSTSVNNGLVELKGKTAKSRDAMSPSPAHSEGTNTTGTHGFSLAEQRIKLIDFGSACFEGQASHTYIQSRFYRSPEVLIGLSYDSAIDMWSLGCVAAELFLGLPILPGVHEHDQICRISEMIGDIPDWMLEQGSKAQKYFVKFIQASTPATERSSPPARQLPRWRTKTQQEYIASLSQSEIKRKGGLAKLEKQPGNRYFKRKRLADIILHKGQSGGVCEDKEQLNLFVHFLHGIMDPDPWKRWTAFQAASHPFLTGNVADAKLAEVKPGSLHDENLANRICGYHWQAPSDPTIYRRKLLNVQRMRETQQAARQRIHRRGHSRAPSPGSLSGLQEETVSLHNHLGNSQRALSFESQTQTERIQISSSYARLRDDSSSLISTARASIQGPQSYSEAGPSGPFPGSSNEVDFAYALRRPGVVPMDDASMFSSVDLSAASQAPNYGHSQSQHQSSYHQIGSYGSHLVPRNHQRNRLPNGNVRMCSRSFDEGVSPIPDTKRHSLPQTHRSLLPSNHESIDGAAPPPQDLLPIGVGQSVLSRGSDSVPTLPGVLSMQLPQQAIDGNMAAQIYLQQQHVAIQQQQLLLQKQQAALALQQQQLQAYGMNPALLNCNAPNPASLVDTQPYNVIGTQVQTPNATGLALGYYCVTGADGTPMMVATNQGMVGYPMAAQTFPGQIPGSVGQPQNVTAPTISGIPGMFNFAPGSTAMIQTVAPPGMNFTTYDADGAMYPNNRNQYYHYSQQPPSLS